MQNVRQSEHAQLEALPIVDQPVARAVSRRRDRTPAGGVGKRLGRAMIYRHNPTRRSAFSRRRAALRPRRGVFGWWGGRSTTGPPAFTRATVQATLLTTFIICLTIGQY